MTRTRKLIIGGLALAAVIGGVVAAAAHRHGGFGGHGWHRGGGHGGEFGFLAHGGAMCGGRGAEMADIMAVRLEHRLKTTDAQKPALDELKAALRAGAAKVEASCPPRSERAADGARPPKPTPPERLARLEAGLAARLEAIRTVRPVAEKFYATLTDEQKAKLAERDRGPGGWHRMKHDGEWRGGRDGGPEAPKP